MREKDLAWPRLLGRALGRGVRAWREGAEKGHPRRNKEEAQSEALEIVEEAQKPWGSIEEVTPKPELEQAGWSIH